MKLRLVSFLLCALLVLCSLPMIGASALESTGNAKFDAFINDKRFTNGASWPSDALPIISSYTGWGCCSYCADFVKYCFDERTPQSGSVFYSISEIRAGDVINLGSPTNGTGHWFVVLKRSGNSCYVAEGSYSGKVRVGWNYTISGNRFSQDSREFTSGYHFLDRLPEPAAPVLSLMKSKTSAGEIVRVSWNEAKNAESYRLLINRNGTKYIEKSLGKVLYWSGTLEPGTYDIYVTAVNSIGQKTSNKMTVKSECTAHNYVTWVAEKEATCTEPGTKYAACTVCGYKQTDSIKALGHSYGSWETVRAATGNTEGLQSRTCKRCSKKESKPIPAFGTDIKVSLVNKQTVRISGLDKDNDLIRYAKGNFSSLNEIKAASGANYVNPNGKNTIDINITDAGIYTVGVRGAGGKDEAIFKVEIELKNPFVDVPDGSWYTQAVLWCYNNGYMSGTSSDRFSPSTSITRAMLVQMFYASEGSPAISYKGFFSDVAKNTWYASAVEWAYIQGISGGTSDGVFSPNGKVTREQLATFLYAYKQYKSGTPTFKEPDLSKYTDRKSISNWALTGVKWAISQGILSGTSATTLSPKAETTRAQSAVALYSFFN